MSDRQVLEWLNENSLRSYPLTEAGDKALLIGLSLNRCVLDASLIFSNPPPSQVRLESILFAGGRLCVKVTGQTPFLLDQSAPFPQYVRNHPFGSCNSFDRYVFGLPGPNDVNPDQFAQGGSLLVLGEEMARITSSVAFQDIEFEPACVLDFSGALRGVSALRDDEAVLQGQVELRPGKQFGLQLNGQTIKMSAGRNQGQPIGCQSFFPDVVDDCDSVAGFINGVAPKDNPGPFTLRAGSHVQIFPDPENHRIYIGLDFTAADVCRTPKLPPTPLK